MEISIQTKCRDDIVVADMVADMVTDMEVHMVADMELDKVADMEIQFGERVGHGGWLIGPKLVF